MRIPSEAHEDCIALLCATQGWRSGNFFAALKHRLNQKPWRNDGCTDQEDVHSFVNAPVLELVRFFAFRPDAFRFRVEHKPWNWPVLVIELLEVTVSNPLSQERIEKYCALWRACDYTDRLHLRVFETYGDVLHDLVTENTMDGMDAKVEAAA